MRFPPTIEENPDGSFTIDPQSRSNCVYTVSAAQKDRYLRYSRSFLCLIGLLVIGLAYIVFLTDFGLQASIAFVAALLAMPFLKDLLLRRIFRGAIITRRSAVRSSVFQTLLGGDAMRAAFPRWVLWLLLVISAALLAVTCLPIVATVAQGQVPDLSLLALPAVFLIGVLSNLSALRYRDGGEPTTRAR